MIQEFYGLEQEAFSLSPDLEFLYLSRSHEEAVAHLAYGLEQNEDIILICGDIGTGKTLALHRLVEQVSRSFVPVMITVTTLDFEQLLRLVLMKLGVEIGGTAGTAELIFRFENTIVDARKAGKKVLLIIDEGQNLPLEALESIRLLMNLGQPGGQALQLVLAGQLGLRAHLEDPRMRQLRQRIRVDYQLEFLSREELEGYVAHRLAVAGRSEPLFRKDALDKIHRLSKGVPRVVNHLASKALLAGYVEESSRISAKHVEDVVAGVPEDEDAAPVTRTVHPTPAPSPAAAKAPLAGTAPDDIDVLVDSLVESGARPAPGHPVPARSPEPSPAPTPAAPARPTVGKSPATGRRGGGARLAWWGLVVVVVLGAAGYLTYPTWWPRLAAMLPRSLSPTTSETEARSADGEVALRREADHGGPAGPMAEDASAVTASAEGNGTTGGDGAGPASEPAAGTASGPASDAAAEPTTDAGSGSTTDEGGASAPLETPRTEEPAVQPEAAGTEDSFIVHVASFRTAALAENFTRRLAAEGYAAAYHPGENDRGKTWYRVYLGPYPDRKEAYRVSLTLKERGVIGFYDIKRVAPTGP